MDVRNAITHFRGRILLAESFVVTPRLRQLISDKSPSWDILEGTTHAAAVRLPESGRSLRTGLIPFKLCYWSFPNRGSDSKGTCHEPVGQRLPSEFPYLAIRTGEHKITKGVADRRVCELPATVCTVLTISLYILTTQVIPKFAVIFESVHMSLPVPTQILMSISKAATGHPLLTLGLAGAFLYLVFQFPRIFSHFHQLHRLSLRLPVIGVIQRR